MRRYVIELRPDCKVVQEICESDGRVSIGAKSIEYLEELNSDYINEHYGELQETAYRKGRESVFHELEISGSQKGESADDAYQRGLEDGKAIHEKGCEGCKYEGRGLNKLPCMVCCNSRENCWTAKDDKIEVGDEVTDLQSGANFVVTHLWKNNHGEMGVSGFNNDCSAFSATLDKVSKTGRHFDIASILEEMRCGQ